MHCMINQFSTSVSACYYCMFNIAKVLLIKKGFKPKTHTGVISLFGQEYVLNDSFDRKISKYLSSTQSLREVADFDAIDNIDESVAKDCINKAELFMEEAEKFLYKY
ncbi:MAG: HEPN domain-containing protein [Methanosphaera stadtmanae]|nr:HEPN domain-containing protein [Methanosphaera stadtmanae]